MGVGIAQVQHREHRQQHKRALGLPQAHTLAEESDDGAEQHGARQEKEDAQQAEGGQHLSRQKQEEPVTHTGRQRSGHHEPKGRIGHPDCQRAQQRRDDHARSGHDFHQAVLVEGNEAAKQQHHEDAHGDVGRIEGEVRVERPRYRVQHSGTGARPGESERGPGAGAPVGRDIATATPQKRAAILPRFRFLGHGTPPFPR